MILVADSGSSKTDWRLITKTGKFEQFETNGLNPNFASDAHFDEALVAVKEAFKSHEITTCWFYGAGCGNEQQQQVAKDHFSRHFDHALVHVHSDMLGAAHALCGDLPGMAAILGTGMNSCLYDGKQIVSNNVSLGYVLGDEGSGAYLGKLFIAAYLKNQLPDDLRQNYERRFPFRAADIIQQVYREPQANKFLAQFAKFIYQNSKNPYCTELVVTGFRSFFREQIHQYPDYANHTLHLTGSVAFYFSNLLRRVAAEEGVSIGKIVEKPVAALALYHAGE